MELERTQTTIRVSEPMWTEFRMTCLRLKTTANDVIESMIEGFVIENAQKNTQEDKAGNNKQ
jgi:hypothetical protein